MNFYADRGYAFINGIEAPNVKSIKWTVEESVTRVDTMTRNKRSSGWKKGNRKVTGSFELEVPDDRPQFDLAFQYGQDVTIVATLGNGERHSLKGIVQTSQDLSGSVGETSKTINFEAIDAVNENGPAVNAGIGF